MINHYIITVSSIVLLYCITISSSPDTAIDSAANEISDSAAILEATVHDSITAVPDSFSQVMAENGSKDSLVLDSLQKIKRRDIFLRKNTYFRKIYQKYPESLDSLFDPVHLYPFQVFQADGMNLSEIVHFHPSFTSVPVTLSSNLNRFLFYGFPAAHVSLYSDKSLFNFYTDPSVGPNLFSAAEINNLYFSLPGIISYTQQPSKISKPETIIFWENGVFKENILNIRFARPFAERFNVGVFSNYQHFKRQQFNHRNGGLYTFYENIYESKSIDLDSSYVSYKGTNPLTDEQVTSVHLGWSAKNGTESRLSYKYADLHNDLATEAVTLDTNNIPLDTTSLAWENRAHYSHIVNANISSFPIGQRFKVNTETFLRRNVNRITPVSSSIASNPLRRGENLIYGGAVKPCFSLGKRDTISLQFNTLRDETVRYDKSKKIMHHTQSGLTLKYNYAFSPLALSGTAAGTFGYTFIKLNGSLKHTPTWKVSLSNRVGKQTLDLFALYDLLPPHATYDTSFNFYRGYLMDRYLSFGAEGLLQYKKVGLKTGVCIMYGVDSTSVLKAWPNGIPPYREPEWVISVTPLFGRWHGLSLSSQWLISQKKPYIKSKSILSYHLNREGRTQHLNIDLGLDYWSERDLIYYAGNNIWNRPILDLHCKIAVQILTFRLFYKIDNIFNSNFAYVPGYYMPGLIFRWGFNWLIQG